MHWTRRVSLLCVCLTVVAVAREGRAQQQLMDSTGTVILDDFSGAMTLSNDGGTYLLFQKWVGDGVGHPNGYSRIGLRAKLVDWESSHIFGEMHGLITDNGRFGFNVGSGYRWMMNESIFGVHAWYDNYESINRFRYDQVSFGAEYLHPGFDFRVNGYVPTGNRENFLRVVDPGTEVITWGHNLGTIGTGMYERALNGWDAEAGIPMPFVNWLRGYAGMYFLNDKQDETTGFKARIEGRVAQGVILNVVTTDDERFGTNVNLNVEVRADGRGAPTRFGQDYSALSRRYDQVWRNWSVQIGNTLARVDVPLINPDSGNPYYLYWIDNTNAPGGDGTFENPNAVLPTSDTDSDIFLVRTGVGNTLGNIRLGTGQQLLGEGVPHLVNTDRLGLIQIPNFATTGATPTLAALNPGQPVVTLGNNTEVRGFDILGNSVGIGGTNVNGFLIQDVNVQAAAPVQLSNAFGVSGILDSTFTSTGGGPAISIANTLPTPLNLTVGNVQTSGGSSGLSVTGTGADIRMSVDNLTGTNHSIAGIHLKADSSYLLTNFTNTTMSGLAGSGVVIELDSTTGTTTFTNLTATGNAQDGVRTVATDSSAYTLNIIDSDLRGNGDDNIDIDVLNFAQMNVLVDPTNASNAGDNNLELSIVGNAKLDLLVQETDLTNATQDAVNVNVSNAGVLNLTLETSSGASAGRDGLNLRVLNGSTATVSVDEGSFAGSGRTGVAAEVVNGSTATITLLDTPGQGNGTSGFAFDVSGGAVGGSSLTANVTNGNFSNNPVSNIVGTVSGNSLATLNFNNVLADDASSTGGLNLRALTGGDIVGVWTGGSISNTQGNGVTAFAQGVGSGIDLTFNGVAIDGNAGDGVNANLQNGGAGSELSLAFNSYTDSSNTVIPTTIRNNAGDGVDFTADGAGATGALQFGGATVTGNTGDGVRFNVTGGAAMTGTETAGASNEFSGNGGRAIRGTVSGAGSTAAVAVGGATISSDADDALVFNVDNGGAFEFSLSNSTISSLTGDGLVANVSNGGTATFNLNSVLANNTAGSGYVFNGTNNSLLDVNFTGAMQATGNAENGILFNMASGADITFDIVGGDLSGNGTSGNFSGLRGIVDGAGSSAVVSFTDTKADNNTLHGFNLDVTNGGLLTATFNSTTDGATSVTGNNGNAIRIVGSNANQVNLLMLGNGDYSSNAAAGVNYDVNGAAQGVLKASGQFNDNAGDGISVAMANVTTGAIDITGSKTSLSGNTGHGVNINLTNTNLIGATVGTTSIAAFRIDGATIVQNGGDGIRVNSVNSDASAGVISNNIIEENENGIALNLNAGSDWNLTVGGNRKGIAGNVGNNQINLNRNAGILLNADSGNSQVAVLNNDIVSNVNDNIVVNLNGTANVDLDINGNNIDGDGRLGGFQVGRNFQLSEFSPIFDGFPPDTMGSVGPNHIVEVTNWNFAIYDKNTGATISNTSDEQFWVNAGIPAFFIQSGTGDPRIVYDLQSQRWFVVAFDLASVNNLYVAVSNTSDPTQGFQAVQFEGDIYGFRFVDYPTLGLDADGLYIGTNNFNALSGGFAETGLFVIPKASLLAATPSTAGATFFGQLPASISPDIPQGVVDYYSPADGKAITLSAQDFGGSTINRLDILNIGQITTQLAPLEFIDVDPFQTPPNAEQPPTPLGPPPIAVVPARLSSNVIASNGSLWLTHNIRGSTGNAAVRWYEIDEATNTVKQSGTIESPDLDYIFPSIAVNQTGQVVIGFTSTGSTQFASTAVAYGNTVDGVTTFEAPIVTRAGGGVQNGFGSFTRNRWGDYSATVIDPTDPSRFWSFQQYAGASNPASAFDDVYGIQVTEITYDERSTITGTTSGSGVRINLNGDARLAAGSTFNNNNISGHGGDGLSINVGGTANVAGFTMTGTTITGSGGQGIDIVVASADPAERSVFNIGQLGAARNNISGNAQQNIRFETTAPSISQLQTAANPDVLVQTGLNNPAAGAYRDLNSGNIVSATFNVLNSDINNSTSSHGLELIVGSSTLVNSQIAGNSFSNNSGDDIRIRPVVSNDGTLANPPSSINSAAPNADVLVYDPVAHLDLVLGSALVNGDAIPDSTPLATVRNVGESISISFFGDSFTNADPFKTGRTVRLAGQVQIAGTLDTNNTFTSIPSINAIFAPQAGTFNIVGATAFPDITVP